MKKQILNLSLILSSSLLFAGVAKAGAYQEFDRQTLQLVNALQLCPQEMETATAQGRLDVIAAFNTGSRGIDATYNSYTITTGVSSPLGRSKHMVVTISRIAEDSQQVHAPDAPMQWVTTCKVEKADPSKE